MNSLLKEHLTQITNQLTPESTLEDVYEQLSLLTDIEISEKQESDNEIYTQKEVRERFEKWSK